MQFKIFSVLFFACSEWILHSLVEIVSLTLISVTAVVSAAPVPVEIPPLDVEAREIFVRTFHVITQGENI